MKKLLALLLTLSTLSFSTMAQSKDSEEIASAVERLRIAMLNGEKAGLESAAAEEISYGHSSGLIEDKAAFVENIASGNTDFVTLNFTDFMIRIVGNTAIVRHKMQGETQNKEKVMSPINLNVLEIWLKQKGQWKLLARQAAKIV